MDVRAEQPGNAPAAPETPATPAPAAHQAHPPAAHTPHLPHLPHLPALPPGAHVGDARGLTATGAVAVALGAGLAGGLVDVLTGAGLRTVFAICFVLGCAVAAYKVHREDLLAAVVIPPLAYVAITLGAALFRESTRAPGGFLAQQVYELFDALILRAPALLAATAAAALIAFLRGLGQRKR